MSDPLVRRSVSQEQAQVIIDASTDHARKVKVPCCVAIVDDAGHLTAFVRMDGSGPLNIRVAMDKAFTAAGLGMPTAAWFEFIQTEPALAAGAATGIERMILFGGGIPIRWGDIVLGGIGVAGGRPNQDVEIAETGLAALEQSR